MGMGHFANTAVTISIDNMWKLLPAEMNKLQMALEQEGYNIEDIFLYDGEDEDFELSLDALEELTKKFRQITEVDGECLDIYPCYHDSANEGDRYDTVDGAFFTVDGAVKSTAPAIKFAEFLEDSAWVEFG